MPCNCLRLNKGSKKKEYFSLIFEKRRFSKLSEKYFEIKENSYITNVTFFSSLGSVNQIRNLRKKLFIFTIQAEPDLETNTSQDSWSACKMDDEWKTYIGVFKDPNLWQFSSTAQRRNCKTWNRWCAPEKKPAHNLFNRSVCKIDSTADVGFEIRLVDRFLL